MSLIIKRTDYDIIFAGWGASACILLNEMAKTKKLEGKRILILDPDEKQENDKTFCFWAEPSDEIFQDYKSIVSNSWNKIQINNNTAQTISPLKYYHLNSIDLYNLARKIINNYDIEYLKESVLGIYKEDKLFIESDNKIYTSSWVFDGRPPDFSKLDKKDYYISQSFFGYKISLENSTFDSDVYHMMDFRVSQNTATQFIYILPYSKTKALVELTRFGKQVLNQNEAEQELEKFIQKHYGKHEILETEKGIIPMSSVLPKNEIAKNCVNIGTRAGNVKPSTGYAFKNMFKQAKAICSTKDFSVNKVAVNKRFLFYDQLLLIILTVWPSKGRPIFERLFKIKSSHFVLNFLDEKTSITEDLGMFTKLQVGVFIKALFLWIYWRLKPFLIPLLMVFYVIYNPLSESVSSMSMSSFQLSLLIFGLLVVGIPHGALDHLTGFISNKKKISLKFIMIYLALMVPIFLLWYWFPLLGLIFFLIYSSWHFGQTDMENWQIKSKYIGFVWGIILLGFLLLTHIDELNVVLKALEIQTLSSFKGIDVLCYSLIIFGYIISIYYKKTEWILLVTFLLFSKYINLIFAFGLYFIFHHSRLGWKHLKKSLAISHLKMYLLALPFNIGAIVLFFLFFNNFDLTIGENIAYFFIFLSCVSFPHVISMDVFYKNRI